MIEPNKLQAICIRQATQEEISNLPRMCYISEHAITRALEISKQKWTNVEIDLDRAILVTSTLILVCF